MNFREHIESTLNYSEYVNLNCFIKLIEDQTINKENFDEFIEILKDYDKLDDIQHYSKLIESIHTHIDSDFNSLDSNSTKIDEVEDDESDTEDLDEENEDEEDYEKGDEEDYDEEDEEYYDEEELEEEFSGYSIYDLEELIKDLEKEQKRLKSRETEIRQELRKSPESQDLEEELVKLEEELKSAEKDLNKAKIMFEIEEDRNEYYDNLVKEAEEKVNRLLDGFEPNTETVKELLESIVNLRNSIVEIRRNAYDEAVSFFNTYTWGRFGSSNEFLGDFYFDFEEDFAKNFKKLVKNFKASDTDLVAVSDPRVLEALNSKTQVYEDPLSVSELYEECGNIKFLYSKVAAMYDVDEEVLRLSVALNSLNSFDFSLNQKLELFELLKNNEIAKNKLVQIIDNHLESNYSFESLMNYLKKIEKKNILNV